MLVISRGQVTYLCISLALPVLGQGSEMSCPRTFSRKTKRIHFGLQATSLTATTEPRKTPTNLPEVIASLAGEEAGFKGTSFLCLLSKLYYRARQGGAVVSVPDS